ncbi:hypothetical protein B0J12DRAFT_656890 [Macrophomina phaseolina]|uniref:Thymidylate kinase n=1 Tax=Macrophomina phaseolina TaxID=35725 RepID=A0ABQ8GF24_9PEZI|nr:hypothetical protein B0J12DRAFT_656890 [Macrophomina phaseolina]
MTAHVSARQPFAALDGPRLHTLHSAKNRQNSIAASSFSLASSESKHLKFSPSKRRHAPPTAFDDDFDSENVDPALLDSPTKRSKNLDGTPKKVSKSILKTDVVPASSSSARHSTPLSASEKPRNASAAAQPSISTSRGSPKHKRVGILSKRRTTRIDPPSFGLSPRRASGLPFSIDAALSGTISSYAPSPKAAPAPKPVAPTLDEAMPRGWFFEIHEDSPEQEATNMMEHSALILDISSDDDSDTRAENESREKGKENIPPPDYHLAASISSHSASGASDDGSLLEEPISKIKQRRRLERDAMEEDRSPLGDLPAADYFAEGLDANSHVIVDGTAPEKPSSLSKECTFEDIPTPEEKDAAAVKPSPLSEVVGKATEPAEPEAPPPDGGLDFAIYDENADEATESVAPTLA